MVQKSEFIQDTASTNDSGELLVLAPAILSSMICEELHGTNFFIQMIDQSKQLNTQIEHLLEERKRGPAAVLCLIRGNRAPGKAIPHPLIKGVPIGLLPCSDTQSIRLCLRTFRYKRFYRTEVFGVLAMWKDFYLKWGKHFYDSLRKGYRAKGIKVRRWFADQTERADLCQKISQGPDLLIYAGHGRSRGWTGYRGLRWSHLEAIPLLKPTGTVICLTCGNLEVVPHNRIPFGVRWVRSGRLSAFLGAVEGIHIPPLIKMSHMIREVFATGECPNIGTLMQRIDRQVQQANDPTLKNCWRKFRLIGDPLTPL